MSDIVVTINPSNNTSVSIGAPVSNHAITHAPSGSDSLENYYYPRSNPSGYVSSGDFATTGYVADVSGAIVSQISFPSNVVFTTGDQNISGVKNFYSRPTINGTGVLLSGEAAAASTGYLTGYVSKTESGAFYPTSNPSGYITGVDLGSYVTISYVTGISGHLQGEITSLHVATGDLNIRIASLESETGNYYLASNPSGYITGIDLGSYATTAYVTGVSGYLQNQISTLNSQTGQYATGDVIRPSDTGSFYASSNPSGFITGVDLSLYSTVSYSTGISGFLQQEISSLQSATGSYVTGSVVRPSETGNFIVVADLASYQTIIGSTGISGYLQSQINEIDLSSLNVATGVLNSGLINLEGQTGSYVLKSESGEFYPASNPSGYITGVDLSSYANVSLVTGASGYLQDQVSSLQSQTGNYLTGESDPLFIASTAYTITPTLTGNWTNSYQNSLTGISVAGSTTKTITLYQINGGVLTADFTDSEGTGDGSDFYIYSGSFNASGDGNLVLNRTGDNGSIAVSLDGRYALLTGVTGISGYLQYQIDVIDLSPLEAATGNLNSRVLVLEGQTGSYVTGNVIRPSDTGVFYPITNPSGYITGVDLSNYTSVSFVTGISGYQSGLISNLYAATGLYAQASNTGGFLTTGAGDSRYYPLSANPSSYLVAADIVSYATTGYVVNTSGHLQSQVDTLQSFTGQGSSGYNDSLTGISVDGINTKTITLYQRDGGTLSANFTDLQGTGGSISDVVYLTGAQDVSGVKNFYDRPTVNGTGVLLSGEIFPSVREIYIDAGAMLTGVSGASPSSVSVANSGVAYDCFNFDASTTGYAHFKLKLPDYNLGNVKARFDWTTSGASGSVVWGIQGFAAGDGDSLLAAWGSAQEVSDSFIAGTGVHTTSSTPEITLDGSPQANDLLFFRVYRNTFSTGDTLAVDASLLGLKIQYTGVQIQLW